MKQMHFILLIIILLLSCNEGKGDKRQMINPKALPIITLPPDTLTPEAILPDTIIDADYTFEEATKDSGEIGRAHV